MTKHTKKTQTSDIVELRSNLDAAQANGDAAAYDEALFAMFGPAPKNIRVAIERAEDGK